MLNLAEEMRVNLESRTEAWHDPSTQVGDLFQYKEKEMMQLFVSYASKHVIGQKVHMCCWNVLPGLTLVYFELPYVCTHFDPSPVYFDPSPVYLDPSPVP